MSLKMSTSIRSTFRRITIPANPIVSLEMCPCFWVDSGLMKNAPLIEFQRRHTHIFDILAMLLYIAIVYGWFLRVGPLGRDYALLSGQADVSYMGITIPVHKIGELFGASPVPYHLLNLTLLCGCTYLTYRLTQMITEGPGWLGRLAAALFLANPVHTEAVMNLCGFVDLFPAFLALLALWGYVRHSENPSRSLISFLWPCILAVGLCGYSLDLIFIFFIYEYIMKEPLERRTRLLKYFMGAAIMVALFVVLDVYISDNLNSANPLFSLFLIFYPIGFLPETARSFHESPLLESFAVLVTILILYLICRKARRRPIVFGLIGMTVAGVFQSAKHVDPVHMIGGGRLLVPNTLFLISLVALFYHMMDHPKWRKTLITFTTLLCLLFFGLQIRANRAWSFSYDKVKEFQASVNEIPKGEISEIIGILPDYQYYFGAPMCLSESIKYDTPFSKASPAFSLLPMHYKKGMNVEIIESEPLSNTIKISGTKPLDVIPWPYVLTEADGSSETEHSIVTSLDVGKDTISIQIVPKNGTLPTLLLPGK